MVAICESFQFTVYKCPYHYVHVYCIDSVRILCVLHRQSILCVLHIVCIAQTVYIVCIVDHTVNLIHTYIHYVANKLITVDLFFRCCCCCSNISVFNMVKCFHVRVKFCITYFNRNSKGNCRKLPIFPCFVTSYKLICVCFTFCLCYQFLYSVQLLLWYSI